MRQEIILARIHYESANSLRLKRAKSATFALAIREFIPEIAPIAPQTNVCGAPNWQMLALCHKTPRLKLPWHQKVLCALRQAPNRLKYFVFQAPNPVSVRFAPVPIKALIAWRSGTKPPKQQCLGTNIFKHFVLNIIPLCFALGYQAIL